MIIPTKPDEPKKENEADRVTEPRVMATASLEDKTDMPSRLIRTTSDNEEESGEVSPEKDDSSDQEEDQ